MQQQFDYVIIGSGAAGCVLAHRLSAQQGVRILLLEAGDLDEDPRVSDIGRSLETYGSSMDWQFQSEPQPGLTGRQMPLNQGKVLGGSTAINHMMYVRGNRLNYEEWKALGNAGWGYDDVLPYFKRSEDFEGGASEYHGAGGPLSVRVCPDAPLRSDAFIDAATEFGYGTPHSDYNGADQTNGANFLQFMVNRDGTRCSASAFVAPLRDRPNFRLETKAEVTRLVLDGKRVVAVEYLQNGQAQRVQVEREVILSAGTLMSPKVLMLSGIGPADQLRGHGIPVVVDLPGVGRNLRDHLQAFVVFRSKIDRPAPTLATGNALFTRTREGAQAAQAAPDLQINFTPSVPTPFRPMLDFGGPASIFLAMMVQPGSVGQLTLRSANPQDAPIIDPNYLQQASDLQILIRGVEKIRELARTKAFADAELDGPELVPGVDTPLEPFLRSQVVTIWHPAGTCKIGTDPLAVVDPRLKVHGVEGVRVADASVMPNVISGNIGAAVFMIGEKAADLVANT
jgi:choline dehydrogenase